MRLKKEQNVKECTICLMGIAVMLLAFFFYSLFAPERWLAPAVALMFFLVLSFAVFLNAQWEIAPSGISMYLFFGKMKAKSYSWEEFRFVSVYPVLGNGRRPEREMIVCAAEEPVKKYKNSRSCMLKGKHLCFENTEENRLIFSPYFTQQSGSPFSV